MRQVITAGRAYRGRDAAAPSADCEHGPVADLEPLLDYWRAQDALFERVEATWWGGVVSDARFPAIQEPNYARVETRQAVRLDEVEARLLPAMARSGSARSHAVVFHPEEQTDLVAQASTRGERIAFDLVMVAPESPAGSAEVAEEIDAFDDAFWAAHRASARLFDVTDEATLDQLQSMEREVLVPAGRRWFAAREAGRPVALAALLVLEGVAYIDHVVTFPQSRRRGLAEALTRRVLAEAKAAGARVTYLLAEPDGAAARIYERVGFEPVAQIASWITPFGGPEG
jgi:ribosomal protein S18 acetylase RimI-like enzyme